MTDELAVILGKPGPLEAAPGGFAHVSVTGSVVMQMWARASSPTTWESSVDYLRMLCDQRYPTRSRGMRKHRRLRKAAGLQAPDLPLRHVLPRGKRREIRRLMVCPPAWT